MSKQFKAYQNSQTYKNSLSVRLQQIVEILYKNNGHFSKGLPSQQKFKEMLQHGYTCYDQLDFIVLEYSRHPVNYLQPKMIAEHMHKIMRVTKYLFSNIRNWIQSYSLDIAKKLYEDRNYYPTEASHQARCSSCNRYVEQILLKDAKEEILGCHDLRLLYDQELMEAQEQERTNKPLTTLEIKEYTGSVNYLTKIIREMEESAHSYSKLAETVEKEDNQQNIALKYLQDLLKSMRRRLGQKCIYRLKKILKNWQKCENEEKDDFPQKGPFIIRQIISESYIPPSEIKKNLPTAPNIMIKRLKDENHQLQIQNNNLNSHYTVTRNSLAFLQKREEVHRREMERLNSLLEEKNGDKNVLATEARSRVTRRSTMNPNIESSPNASTPKITVTANSYVKQTKIVNTKKSKYSKFKVPRMSRQSEAYSSNKDKTLNLTHGEQEYVGQGQISVEGQASMGQGQASEDLDSRDSYVNHRRTADVGCQWEDLSFNEKVSKVKQKNSRTSNQVKSSLKERVTIQNMSRIDERQQQRQVELNAPAKKETKQGKEQKRSIKLIDLNIKSKGKLLLSDNLIALDDLKSPSSQNHTFKQLFESQQLKTTLNNEIEECNQSSENKISVKVLQNEPLNNRISLEKLNVNTVSTINANTISKNKMRELKPTYDIKVAAIKGFPEARQESAFERQIQKIMNRRILTEGAQLKKKVKLIKNVIFKPEHLAFFGGVSESYSYQKNSCKDETLMQEQKKCFSELKNYLVNLRSFKNHLYDNIVMFLKWPFSMIDSDEMQINIVSDKQLTFLLKKFITFHYRKCQRKPCDHMQSFYRIIGLYHQQ